MTFDGDLAAAARHYEHALALEPANTDIIGGAATLAASLNRLDTAIALNEYANARDPLNTSGHANLGLALPRRRAPGRGHRQLPHGAAPGSRLCRRAYRDRRWRCY